MALGMIRLEGVTALMSWRWALQADVQRWEEGLVRSNQLLGRENQRRDHPQR